MTEAPYPIRREEYPRIQRNDQVLGPEAYAFVQPARLRPVKQVADLTGSTVGTSKVEIEEAARDPAIPNLMLPLYSVNDMVEFAKRINREEQVDPSFTARFLEKAATRNQEWMAKVIHNWSENVRQISEQIAARLIVDDLVRKDEVDRTRKALVYTSQGLIQTTGSYPSMDSHIVSKDIGYGPAKESWEVIAPFIPSDMRAELGLIGAYFLQSTMLQAAILNSRLAKVSGDDPKSLKQQANAFASLMLARSEGEEFAGLMKQLQERHLERGNQSGFQAKRLVQVMLLMTGLAAVYLADAGVLSSVKIGALFKKTPEHEVMKLLVKQIRVYLKDLPLELRERVLEGMLAYFDSKPSVKELTDPTRVFAKVMEGGEFPVMNGAIPA